MMPFVGVTVLGNEPTTGPSGETMDGYKAAWALGCDFVRTRIVFDLPLDFAWLDDALARAEAYDLKMALVFWIRRPEAEPRGDTSVGLSFEEYAEAVGAIAEHAKGRVWAYMIENEPDNAPVLPREYAERVRLAVGAIRSADPDALIVAGELAAEGDVRYWVPRWLAAQALTGVWPDAISVHAFDSYRNDWPDPIMPGMVAKVSWLRNAIREYGPDLPIWVTECGAPSEPSDTWTRRDDDTQAAVVRRVLVESVLSGIDAVSWYRAADQADNGEAMKWGILDASAAPKAAFGAWGATLPWLRLGLFVFGVDLGPDRIGRIV